MKRNQIIDNLLKEGFSEKTLVRFSDKQLSYLHERIIGEATQVVMNKLDKNKPQDVAMMNALLKDPVKNAETLKKTTFGEDMKEEKPSAGLSKEKKSEVVKKAKKGGDIGKKGKGFKKIVAKAKEGGAKDPEAVAAAAMWKNIKREDVNEKWEKDVDVKKTGEHAGKTVDELKKQLNSLKEKSKSYQDKGQKVPKSIVDKEAELKFAIRAKQGWKSKIKEDKELKNWVKTLAEENFHNFTSKGEIMELVQVKLNEVGPNVKKGHNGIPEFMTYDSIKKSKVSNEKDTMENAGPATKPKPTTKPKVDPTKKPKTPYNPGPGKNPKPKALKEDK